MRVMFWPICRFFQYFSSFDPQYTFFKQSQYTADPASTIIKDTGQLLVFLAGFLWGENL